MTKRRSQPANRQSPIANRRAPAFYPIILAGGRGTRFWPLSRKRRAKQLLALDGRRTMLQQTVARLLPLTPARRFWVITNEHLRGGILEQAPKLVPAQVIAEPVGRNTAPAIGLAAFILQQRDPEAVLGLFPSDHVIGDEATFRRILQYGVAIAGTGENIVVMGVRPNRPEIGYGYIEAGEKSGGALRVRRFTEKPDHARAEEFCRAGNYFWNSGMFLWKASTLANALGEHLPKTARLLEQIAETFGTRKFASTFRRVYPKCESISVDYAVLEPRSAKGEQASNILCLPAEFGWNDLGSWAALHEHRARKEKSPGTNVVQSESSFLVDAEGNYLHAPGKFVAAIGVTDLVVVETEDALLVTTRERSQDVGKIVKYLDEKNLEKLV